MTPLDNDATVVAPATNPPITATASRAGARHKGKAPAVPPPSHHPLVNAYPSDIGHPANRGLGGPLRLIPFDLTIPHDYPNSFTINPYSSVDQRSMGSFWIECYPMIPNEAEFQNRHIVCYLRKFYVDPEFVQYPTSWDTDVDFYQTPFYLHLGGEFVDLPTVRSIMDKDTELKRLTRPSQGSSQAPSLLSRKLGGRKPDFCLTGYHIGNLAEGTYRKEPAGGGTLKRTDDPQNVLYALIKDKWLPWPEAKNIDLQGKIDLHLKGLQFANMEAITQTIFYSLLGYDLSKCRSAIAWVNGDYTRVLNLSDLVPEGEEVVLEGVSLGGGGGRRILVEADPALVAELRNHSSDCLSAEQFGALAAGDHSIGIPWRVPNSLIADYEDWSLNQEAKERLDATIYLNLALATHHPESVPDPPIRDHSLRSPAPSGGRSFRPRTRSDHDQEPSSKRQKRAAVSGEFSASSQWCSTDLTFIDTAIPPKPLSFTTAEQVLPLEYWTHAEYIDSFSGLGLTFVLATPMEVDVLLARAAKFGWAGALGSGS
ncbi:hypothetical protein B9479_006253 [Cryptococcus floricola]|uniref:Uncharacterized protein n=1 Tax=Cryptococcus floricola TaxID=2591691 RepID=A0A5D3ASV8_9TREE|nr:hypothetical protein B9479_006253 [Cryptococcus floricola]